MKPRGEEPLSALLVVCMIAGSVVLFAVMQVAKGVIP